jgi:hypothetical protein
MTTPSHLHFSFSFTLFFLRSPFSIFNYSFRDRLRDRQLVRDVGLLGDNYFGDNYTEQFCRDVAGEGIAGATVGLGDSYPHESREWRLWPSPRSLLDLVGMTWRRPLATLFCMRSSSRGWMGGRLVGRLRPHRYFQIFCATTLVPHYCIRVKLGP